MNKIKFVVLDVNEGFKIIELNEIDWATLCSYLHEGYLDYEHPTNLEGIWILEDDAYEYIKSEKDIEKYSNKYSTPFSNYNLDTIGNCVLFKPGKTFNAEGNFDDIISLTEEDIERIEEKVNEIKSYR